MLTLWCVLMCEKVVWAAACVPVAIMSAGPRDAQRQGFIIGSDSRTVGADPPAYLQHARIKHIGTGGHKLVRHHLTM